MKKTAENTPIGIDTSFGEYYESLRRANNLVNSNTMFNDALVGYRENYKNDLYNEYKTKGLPEDQAIRKAELETLKQFHAPLPIDAESKEALGVNTLSDFLYKKYGRSDHRDTMPFVRENFLLRGGDEDRANMATPSSRTYARIHGKPLPNPWLFNIGTSLGADLVQGVPIAWLPSWGYSALQAIKGGRVGKFFEDRERQNNELAAPLYTSDALPDLQDIQGSLKRRDSLNVANSWGTLIGSAVSWPLQAIGWGPGLSVPARALGFMKAAKPATASATITRPGFLKRYTGMGKGEWTLYGLPGIGRAFKSLGENNAPMNADARGFDRVGAVESPEDIDSRIKFLKDRAMEEDVVRRANFPINPVTKLPVKAPASIPGNTYTGTYNHIRDLYRDDSDFSKPHPRVGPLFRQQYQKNWLNRERGIVEGKLSRLPGSFEDYSKQQKIYSLGGVPIPARTLQSGWNNVSKRRQSLIDRRAFLDSELKGYGAANKAPNMSDADFSASLDRIRGYMDKYWKTR